MDYVACRHRRGFSSRENDLAAHRAHFNLKLADSEDCMVCKDKERIVKRDLTFICLECGRITCSDKDLKEGHCRSHYNKNRSHILAYCLQEKACYCFSCKGFAKDDATLLPDANKPLFPGAEDEDGEAAPDAGDEAAAAADGRRPWAVVPGATAGRGLRNLGNTCFFNSLMQCLAHTGKLFEYLVASDPPRRRESAMTAALRGFFLLMHAEGASAGAAVVPSKLLDVVHAKYPRFRGYGQQDSHELYRVIIDAVKTEEEKLAKKRGEGKPYPPTFVDKVFGGTLTSNVTCLHCGKVSRTKEDFFDLSLPVLFSQSVSPVRGGRRPHASRGTLASLSDSLGSLSLADPASPSPEDQGGVSIHTLLLSFTAVEKLSGENAYACEHCKRKGNSPSARRSATKQFLIALPTPRVLVLHLKRYGMAGRVRIRGARLQKSGRHVDVPAVLNIEDYVDEASLEEEAAAAGGTGLPDVSKNCRYRLYGMVTHSGGLGGGHYTNFVHTLGGGGWRYFSDAASRDVTEGDTLNAQAYMLFYEKIGDEEEGSRD